MDNEARFAKYDMDIQRLEDKLDIIVEMLSMHDKKIMDKIDDIKNKASNIPNGVKVKPRKIQFYDM